MVQIVIGMRVDELEEPYVPSVVRQCVRCHDDLWVDERIAEQFGSGMMTMCMKCVKELGWQLNGEVAS
jgi:hypothetical protein